MHDATYRHSIACKIDAHDRLWDIGWDFFGRQRHLPLSARISVETHIGLRRITLGQKHLRTNAALPSERSQEGNALRRDGMQNGSTSSHVFGKDVVERAHGGDGV